MTTREMGIGTGRRTRTSRLPVPRRWSITAGDIVLVLVANGLLIVGMWVRHGGIDELATPAGAATAIGQVTALLGTYLALVQLVLMSRSPWIERVLGLDRLTSWHRWVGFACVWLLVGHAVFTTLGFALTAGSGILDEVGSLLFDYPWVLMATVGLLMLLAVAVTSMRAARRRVSYETWFGIHLYAYLGIALAFLHELVVGSDFVGDTVAVWYWVGLYVVTIGLVVAFRLLQPIAFSMRHRFRVAAVTPEGPGVVSIQLTGRAMDRIAIRAGQYLQVRFLTGGGWWRHHPFSISAAPDGRTLRLTVKALGDDTERMLRMPVGTQVFVEGPYGAFTRERVRSSRILLIAGGIGITPLRAMLEERPQGADDVVLLYRARSWDDVVFGPELAALGRRPGTRVQFLVGRRGTAEMPVDPLTPEWLRSLVPDIARRDIFYCGSGPFMDRVATSLHALSIPRGHIHAERFT